MNPPALPVNGPISKSSQRAIPVETGNSYVLLDKDNQNLGKLTIGEYDKGWFFGEFAELPSFQRVRPLFEEHRELVNQQIFSLTEEVEERIASLGLHLLTPNSELVQAIMNVQIGPSSINFQVASDGQGV